METTNTTSDSTEFVEIATHSILQLVFNSVHTISILTHKQVISYCHWFSPVDCFYCHYMSILLRKSFSRTTWVRWYREGTPVVQHGF